MKVYVHSLEILKRNPSDVELIFRYFLSKFIVESDVGYSNRTPKLDLLITIIPRSLIF